jgi:hypothetical protein
MDAVIVLHGLFLLSCDLHTQKCQVMVGEADKHVYMVGTPTFNYSPIPVSTTMTTTLRDSKGKDPSAANLDQRGVLLDGTVISASTPLVAKRVITIPMPDDIYGANRVAPFREDFLNNTPSNTLRSQADSDGRIVIDESVLLRYSNADSFDLIDNGQTISTSQTIDGKAVLIFYSWPKDCTDTVPHDPNVNSMLKIKGGGNPTYQFSYSDVEITLDDPGADALDLPDSVIRPSCSYKMHLRSEPSAKNPKSKSRNAANPRAVKQRAGNALIGAITPLTAKRTGCGTTMVFQ